MKIIYKMTAMLIFSTVFSFSLYGKVPFQTIHLKIKKERFEGDPKFFKSLKNIHNHIDDLDYLLSEQEVWVDVANNSYLEIETPGEGNDVSEKNGRLKYQGKHYILDFDLELALDVTDDPNGKIYDNYTSDTPDYKYYKAKVIAKVKTTCGDNKKRKAKVYSYKILDPEEVASSNQYIEEIKNSDMSAEAKKSEITAVKASLNSKAANYTEWIWVHDNKEQQMFLRKTESLDRVMMLYNITLLEINKDVDDDVFEDVLSSLRIKKNKKKKNQ